MTESYRGKSEEHGNCCISHKFVDAASRNPHKIAVIHASGWAATITSESPQPPPVYDGDASFTFAELSSSIDSLTSRLRRILHVPAHTDPYLIRPEKLDPEAASDVYMPKVLALYMPPSVEYIITVLSVMRCGQAFLPLDPSWPRERVLSIISSSNVTLVIASGSSFGPFGCHPLHRSHWLVKSIVCPLLFFSMNERLSAGTGPSNSIWPCKKESQRKFCYMMYTSGSTGKPKGVCGTEQGLAIINFLYFRA